MILSTCACASTSAPRFSFNSFSASVAAAISVLVLSIVDASSSFDIGLYPNFAIVLSTKLFDLPLIKSPVEISSQLGIVPSSFTMDFATSFVAFSTFSAFSFFSGSFLSLSFLLWIIPNKLPIPENIPPKPLLTALPAGEFNIGAATRPSNAMAESKISDSLVS